MSISGPHGLPRHDRHPPRSPAAPNPRASAPRREREGAAMLVVMLTLLLLTGLAIFAVHSTAFEIRAAGHSRQAMQTEYVAETALISGLSLVDQHGPAAILMAMTSSPPPQMPPGEPPLAPNKHAYRIVADDFVEPPVDAESIGDGRQAYEPFFVVDITDEYTWTGSLAGHRADGYGTLKYFLATYTARGRTRISTGPDYESEVTGDRPYHEGASDARAYGLSGPFGR